MMFESCVSGRHGSDQCATAVQSQTGSGAPTLSLSRSFTARPLYWKKCPRRPKALVLFDIDGTLLRRAVRIIVKRSGGREESHRHRDHTDGIALSGMLDRRHLERHVAAGRLSGALIRRAMPEMVEQAQRAYIRCCPDLRRKVCPGARMLLYELSRRGIPAGLVTGNLTRIGWKKMERAGLRRYLRFGAFAELARDRADLVGIALRHARSEGWIESSSPIALVGDHPNDIRAAKAHGVRSVAVATGLIGQRN